MRIIYVSAVTRHPQPPDPRDASRPATVARTLDSRELLCGEPEVRILHEGREYRLRVTRQRKLILTT
jgi:hemin uptake protein HemP